MKGSVSLIFISHDVNTLRICDTIYKLDKGSLKVIKGPGLGFELDENAVKDAEKNYLDKINKS